MSGRGYPVERDGGEGRCEEETSCISYREEVGEKAGERASSVPLSQLPMSSFSPIDIFVSLVSQQHHSLDFICDDEGRG